MPYANEHACRLIQPRDGAKTRRVNGDREHDGKKYDVIYQQQADGDWEDQAFRYPKETWTADSARNHCESHDGIRFEAASEEDASRPEIERRFFRPVELRVLRADGRPTGIEGYAAVYNALSVDIWGFREKILPGAFADAVASDDDVVCLFNHNFDHILGRRRAGTLRVKADEKGLWFSDDLPDTQIARDLVTSIERGDLDQCSFSFSHATDRWTYEKDDTLIRLIERVGHLYDVSPVTMPAYPDTTVALRSLERAKQQSREAQLAAPAAPSATEPPTPAVPEPTPAKSMESNKQRLEEHKAKDSERVRRQLFADLEPAEEAGPKPAPKAAPDPDGPTSAGSPTTE